MPAPNKQLLNDVMKPNRAGASPTSRPIIIRHGPMMADPTITKPDPNDAQQSTHEKNVSNTHRKNKVIEAPQEEVSPVPEGSSRSDAASIAPNRKSETVESNESAAAYVTEEPRGDSEESRDAQIINEEEPKSSPSGLSKEEQARLNTTAQLTESKKYFLPIREAKRKRRARMTLLLLVLFLVIGIVTADLLIDAGIIQTDIPPLANLIKN